MVSKEQVIELIKRVEDPILHKSVLVHEVKIKGSHISLKVALAKTGTSEQLEVQQEIVKLLKEAGAETVGLRFESLSEEEMTTEEVRIVNLGTPPLLSPESKTTFLAIASGKGGVGKSTVSSNLAVALSRIGYKVGLIDADIYGFSIPDMMEIKTRPETFDNKIIPPERFGVKVMSMAFFCEDNSPVIWRGPMLGKMLNSYFSEVNWGELDFLLLDLPPGTGDIALDLHSMLPSLKEIIVTTPHHTAALVAVRAGKMAQKANHEILGVIENMSYFESKETGKKEYIFGNGGGERICQELETDLFGKLPLSHPDEEDPDASRSIYGADHPLGKVYEGIANSVIAKVKKEQLVDVK